MAQWHSGTVVTVAQSHSSSVAQWHSGTVVQWHSGTVTQWHSGTVAEHKPRHLQIEGLGPAP